MLSSAPASLVCTHVLGKLNVVCVRVFFPLICVGDSILCSGKLDKQMNLISPNTLKKSFSFGIILLAGVFKREVGVFIF